MDQTYRVDLKLDDTKALKAISGLEKRLDAFAATTKKAASSGKMNQARREIDKVAKSYQYADAAAQEYWNNIRKNASKVQSDLKKLRQANIAAFDKEDLRLYRKELGSTETALRRLRGKIPDEQFNRLQHEISQSRREMDRLQKSSRSSIGVFSKLRTAAMGAGVAIAGYYGVRMAKSIAQQIEETMQ